MTSLWLRSFRERPQTAILLLVLSAVAVMTAMLGPLLVRSVHQSALSDGLDAAGIAGTSVSISSSVEVGQPYDTAEGPVKEALAVGNAGAAARLWQKPELIIQTTSIVIWTPRASEVGIDAQINALDDGCGAYVMTEGVCPTRTGQVMISSIDATGHKVRVGDKISFSLARADTISLKVVGTYDAVASAARAGLIRPGTTQGVLAGIDSDPLVMPTAQSADLPLPTSVTAQMILQPGLTVADVAAVQASIEETKLAVNKQDRLLALHSDLPDILNQVDTQARSAQVLILVTGVQAVFLAIFALVVVMQRVGRARAAEWSVGRLRGVPRLRWLMSVYLEPLLALLLGLPLGFFAGIAVARLGVGWVLRPDTPVEPWRLPVMLSAVATVALAIGALVAVSLRSLRQPLADLIQQQAEARRLGVIGAVVHAAVFLLAGATVYQLISGGLLSASGPQLGLLAPGLLALAMAMLAVRGAVMAVRRFTERPPRSLAALVVGRHAARTPSALNPAMIIAVGIGLAVFSSQVWALSLRNQGLRADASTGAATVLTVAVPSDGDLLTAVRAADPEGRSAMAVKDTAVGDFTGPSRVVAVDASRLAAVTSWSQDWANVADLATALRGPTTAAIQLKGTRIDVQLADVLAQPKPLPDPSVPNAINPAPPPELVITVEVDGAWRAVNLGRLDRANKPVKQGLSAELPCAKGCRLVSIGLQAASNQPYQASFTIAKIKTDQQPAAESDAWLQTADRWREQSINETVGDQGATITPKAGASGLAVTALDSQGSGLTAFSPTDTSDPLPALLAPRTNVEAVPGQENVGYGTGLDGQQQKLRVVGQASTLPRALDIGVLVDLTNAQGLSEPSRSQTIEQVWLSPDAPTDIEKRLTDAGLQIQSRESLATHRAVLEHQATSRGAAVAVTISAAGLLLTLLALIAARWSDAGHRGADWRALREGGVSPRRLRFLVGVEIAVPSILGVLVGMLSGAIAARIAAPRLPLVDLAAAGPPLDLRLDWPPIVLISAATIVMIMIIAVIGALAEIRPRRWR